MRMREIITIATSAMGGRLDEAYDTTVRVRGDRSEHDIEVYRNPSRAEMFKLIKASDYGSLRGIITTRGDLLVWDAAIATHTDMENSHPEGRAALQTATYLYLRKDRFELNDLNYMLNDGDGPDRFRYRGLLRTVVDRIRSNVALRRAYGSAVDAPVGLDNESGDTVQMTPHWVEVNVLPSR